MADLNPSHEISDVQTVQDRHTSGSNDDSPPIPNFAEFPGQSFDDVRRDIAIITQILKGHQHGISASSKSPDEALQFWSLMSFILNTGDAESDPVGAKVIAVTGQVFPEEIRTAIFARNTSNFAPPPGSKKAPGIEPAIGIVPILPAGEEKARDLLRHSVKTTPAANFFEHLQDIVTIVNYITVPPPMDKTRADKIWSRMYSTLYFVLRRTYVKLCARILNRRRIWSDCPIVLMQNWYNEHQPAFGNTSVHVKPTLYLKTLLPEQGISPLQDSPDNYPVTVDNAKLWLNAFHNILTVLEEQLSEEVQPKDKDKPAFRRVRFEPPADVSQVGQAIIALNALLDSKVLDIIVTQPLAAYIDGQYQGTKQSKSSQNTNTDTVSPGIGQAEEEDLQAPESNVSLDELGSREYAVTHEPDDDKEAVEASQQHVVRYFKTLTTQYEAVDNLVRRGAVGTTPNKLTTYMFNIAPPILNVVDADISRFKADFLNMFEHSTLEDGVAARRFLAKARCKAGQVNNMTAVHAEASLMGLACASVFHFDPRPDDEQLKLAAAVFSMDTAQAIPVGVSKKCCLCCSMLAGLLAKRGTETVHPRFVLPGTHATIYPWAAPYIGVPLDVLQDIRTQLLQILYGVAIVPTKEHPRSHQTSPALSTRSLFPPIGHDREAMIANTEEFDV
ncbi:hypothetical protein PENSPDRAFT_747041 [Peniophora sp. CONT]|nr:hypothetical protein PENSPDRAFT_747041 [Peniophora sp. CONT]